MEWDEANFLGKEGESIYLHKTDHSFLEKLHFVLHTRAGCAETSDVGLHPYRQVIGVHGYHHLFLRHCVHIVNHNVEQQGGGGGGGAITNP